MLGNEAKVSVVIPVYNVELYVGDAVRSIMNQSLKEIEIIIVNDGSSDQSLDIVTELAREDSRIQIISNANQGLSVARNLGIYRATGKYILFFDSDDFLEEDALELCYNKCQAENLDFVFFDATVFCDDKSFFIDNSRFDYRRSHKYDDTVYSGIDILKKQMATNGYRSSACLSFINRHYLSDIQLTFYPYLLHEDELFTCLLYVNANRVGLVNRAFFHRRLRGDSIMMSSFTFKNVIGYVTVCRELHSYACRYTTQSETKSVINDRIRSLLSGLIANSQDKLPEAEFEKVKHIVYYEFRKYIGWKLGLRLSFPALFSWLLYIKRAFMHSNKR